MASTMSLLDSDGLHVLINIVSVKTIIHRGKLIINPSYTLKAGNEGTKSRKLFAYSRLSTS